MIAKPYKQQTVPTDPRLRAGVKAEGQMAHYLHRAFSNNPETHVLHGLRLEDRQQPEQDGSPGVCQTDHLIVHRWGMFIIESKSVTEEVGVRPDNTGGDQWSRVYQGRDSAPDCDIGQRAN
ncbi:MAG: nuclease-related domain-containing protein [Deltaproteobacteria bacterium]|nr:nuclease-related domain-containing protein [Deltaproteobacteria bacterium]